MTPLCLKTQRYTSSVSTVLAFKDYRIKDRLLRTLTTLTTDEVKKKPPGERNRDFI